MMLETNPLAPPRLVGVEVVGGGCCGLWVVCVVFYLRALCVVRPCG